MFINLTKFEIMGLSLTLSIKLEAKSFRFITFTAGLNPPDNFLVVPGLAAWIMFG